jgi:hypothetical protein
MSEFICQLNYSELIRLHCETGPKCIGTKQTVRTLTPYEQVINMEV